MKNVTFARKTLDVLVASVVVIGAGKARNVLKDDARVVTYPATPVDAEQCETLVDAVASKLGLNAVVEQSGKSLKVTLTEMAEEAPEAPLENEVAKAEPLLLLTHMEFPYALTEGGKVTKAKKVRAIMAGLGKDATMEALREKCTALVTDLPANLQERYIKNNFYRVHRTDYVAPVTEEATAEA